MLKKGGNMKTNKDYYGDSAFFMGGIIRKLENNYNMYGYNSIYTPLLEKTTEESNNKDAYSIVGLNGEMYSLKFDSTISLKRLISEHSDISFPFKRYQIQKSFRPNGRNFNEFYQCDADIIKTTTRKSDAEIIQIASEGLNEIGLKQHVINISHVSFINETITTEDDINGKKIIDIIGEFLEKDFSEDTKKGLIELKTVLEFLPKNVLDKCHLDTNMSSDSEYYTGIIFNGIVNANEPKVLFRGGRYDKLIKNSKNEYLPSVGMAYVLEDVLDTLKELGKDKDCYNDRIFFYSKDESPAVRNKVLEGLREKYEVLTIDSEDLTINEFVSYCKNNNASLIGLVNNDELELYRIEDFEKKYSKDLDRKMILERKEV